MSQNIGDRIRELRIEKGLTLSELGRITKLSAGHLSQIERNKTTPSLTTLMDIAKVLDAELRYFFETESEVAFIRRPVRGKDNLIQSPPIIKIPLTPENGSKTVEAFRVTIQAQTTSENLDLFLGEELFFMLSGKLIIHVGDEWIELAAGDSIHIDAYQSRSWSNTGNDPCVFIWGRGTSLESH